MTFARIIGTGGFLPKRILSNAELAQRVDTSDEWIVARTGIRERHIADDDEGACDLAEQAARRAIEAAAIDPRAIDLIVLATSTPDKVFPSTACLLQRRLKMHGGCPAFDLQAACAGYIYALSAADNFIRAGAATCALVVGVDLFSRLVDWSDRSTCVLFGDGAGATVLAAADAPGILSTHLHADGRYEELLHVPTGISKNGAILEAGGAFVQMKGNEVFRVAVQTLGRIVEETLAANGMKKSAIDWLVPHQANIRIIQATARKLAMPMERVVVTVDRHGNTSAASVPLAFDEAVRDGRIRPGQTVLMEAFGGGFVWGSALLRC